MGQQCVKDACDRHVVDRDHLKTGVKEQHLDFQHPELTKADRDDVRRDENGLKQGYGRYQESGFFYEGNFVDDLKHGDGVLTWPDGRQYQGQFDKGKFHGKATMVWPDGRKYVGQYVENRKQGFGRFFWPDGRHYEGEWLDGRRHGRGAYTNQRQETRWGQWEGDRPIAWDGKNGEKAEIPVKSRSGSGSAAGGNSPSKNTSGSGAVSPRAHAARVGLPRQ